MARDTINVMIGGEAGQGLVTIGNVLAKTLVRAGYHILVSQDYMSRVRGGHNTFTILASTQELDSPQEGLDLLLALDQATLEIHRAEMKAQGLAVGDEGLTCGESPCFNVAMKELTEGRYVNTVALGIAACLLGLDEALVGQALEAQLGKKSAEVAQKNTDALAKAYEHTKEHGPAFEPLAPPPGGMGQRIMLGGNEAIALGALAGGLKLLSFYPMTPSTSVALTVIAAAEKLGVVVEQAEDEIAAINMAIGASYAGAPAMVTTSGGGYALMNEGLSLAGITETPVVVILVQRPGPATGLPTRTEQGDLEFALYGGHGEFPRAIMAPGSLEQCFELTYRAFHLAEKWQTPVLVLNDQYQADSLRGVAPFSLEGKEPVKAGTPGAGEEGYAYKRYVVTENGVSPRAIPALGEYLVLADSDEHDEEGHIIEDGPTRIVMQEKRMRKLEGLRAEAVPPEFGGAEEPELLLVCWGSARGAVKAACAELAAGGRSVGWCHFSQVWPLQPAQFLSRLEKAGEVVMVEGNQTGQMARVIQRESGFTISRLVSRYDGRPLTAAYILDQLDR